MDKQPIKILVVGDTYSGKTWLWQSYFQKRKQKSYTETIFDNHCSSLFHHGKEITITLFEACGDDDYSDLRKLLYPGTNVVILCVPVDNPLFSVKRGKASPSPMEKWCQEIKEHCKGVPVLVVGTKKDIRDDTNALLDMAAKKFKPLKLKDISSISKKFKQSVVSECSSLTGEGVNSVFQLAVKLALDNNKR